MGFRFFRRIRIAPGISLNLSKSGGSVSFGPRGAKLTLGTSGVRGTVGIPGTGLFYTSKLSPGASSRRSGTGGSSSPSAPAQELSQPVVRPEDRLDLGFFQRLTTPPEEQGFADGLKALVQGNEALALEDLRNADHLPDGAFMAGLLALKQGQLQEAAAHLVSAYTNASGLGTLFTKYGIDSHCLLSITEEVTALVTPCAEGVLLALVEVYQSQGRLNDAIETLKKLWQIAPQDPVVRLSLVELMSDTHPGDAATCQKVVKVCEGVQNDSEVHAAMLLYKAKALLGLSMPDGALNVLSDALKVTKDRSQDLIKALHYERALACEAAGQAKQSRSELEKVYAVDPDYEDVAARLGVK